MSTHTPASGSPSQSLDGSSVRAAGSRFAFALAVAVPLVAYLVTLSGDSYWLDAGEFVAAAINLDIAHPPGHPLTAIYGKLWTLLPLGPLPFRVALGQAAAAALAAGLLFRACGAGAHALGVRAPTLVLPAALAGAWLPALAFGIWFQAVRPEVYALQGLLCMLAAERLVQVELQRGTGGDVRALYAAAFAVGLGLTNHHLMAFFLFPALLWSAAGVAARRRSLRPILGCALFGLLALAVYVYLPLRAARNPPANLGAPLTLERMYWVVSARVYARDMGGENPQPLSERFADLGVALVENLHLWAVLAALCGLYLGLRSPRSRPIALLWLLIGAAALGIRPWLGPVRGNPDAVGYLFAGFAALGALASCSLAAVGALAEQRPRLRPAAIALLWLGAGLVLATQLSRHAAADLSRFHGADPFDEYRLRQLPPRTLLVLATPQAVFRHFERSTTEGLRRDVALVPLPFLRYPGVADSVVRAEPQLRELVDRFLVSDQLQLAPLLRLASRRPVMTEIEAHVPPETQRALLPAGLLYAVVNPSVVPRMLSSAAGLQRRIHARVAADLGPAVHETETSRQLLWVHYMDALYYAAHERIDLAREALAAALRLHPHDAHLHALQRALAAQRGPLDVRPFFALRPP